MKKLIFLLMLVALGAMAYGQNAIRVEGRADSVNMAGSSTAATSANIVLPPILGLADWSVQIMPAKYGTLTSDSVYATIKIFVTNSEGYYSSRSVWSEPKEYVTSVSSTSGAASAWEFYPLRDTLDNTTVALSPGLVISGRQFQNTRLKVQINRPATTDSVSYKVYYVFKYPQQGNVR